MNAQQIENQEIWKQIKGAEKLLEIYTYFPTLHDAEIKNIVINNEEKSFYLTVDYCDFIKKPEDAISTRITICWRNIQEANFNWYSQFLYGMKFSKEDGFVKTKFTDFSFGFDGEIISDDIEILDVEIEPKIDEVKLVKISIK